MTAPPTTADLIAAELHRVNAEGGPWTDPGDIPWLAARLAGTVDDRADDLREQGQAEVRAAVEMLCEQELRRYWKNPMGAATVIIRDLEAALDLHRADTPHPGWLNRDRIEAGEHP